MSNNQDFGAFSLPTEIWVVASKRKDGSLPDYNKILGMGYYQGKVNDKYGEKVFFAIKEDAEAFWAAIDEEMRKYFGVFRAWIEIKE